MTKDGKVYLLRHRNSVILVSSNLKACYDCILNEVPPFLHHHFKSYAQVNRDIKKVTTVDFPIPEREWYYIERRYIISNFKRDWLGSAGVQPG